MSENVTVEALPEPEIVAVDATEEPWGWRILDQDGNVVASGPTIEAIGFALNEPQEENN